MLRWKIHTIIIVTLLLALPLSVYGQSSSPNYQINEYFIGPGGSIDLNSSSYNARASLGDTGVGNAASVNYQLYGGFTTTEAPYIELFVNATNIDMGLLDSSTTGYGTASFSIRTYLASGYVITSAGTQPTNEHGDVIPGINPRAAHTPGASEFGMNLTTNTDPAVIGALPVQVPDGTFSFGVVGSDYATSDEYKYVDGDTIAESASSSGQTDFTISYVMNVSDVTPAGLYVAQQTVVATSSF